MKYFMNQSHFLILADPEYCSSDKGAKETRVTQQITII